jgi:hypothetical protein
MPSIAKAQAAALSELGGIGQDKNLFSPVALNVVENILVQYGAEFQLKVVEYLNQAQNIASGALGDNITPEVVTDATTSVLRIRLLEYYDYVNKGVKGVRSNRNAPNSPYQYRNFGVPQSMRQNLRTYIESGKAKIRVASTQAGGLIGNEKKKKSLIDTKVDTMGYLIKAFGIKGSKYFDKAFNEVFKDLNSVLAEAAGRDIVLTLSGINLKGK